MPRGVFSKDTHVKIGTKRHYIHSKTQAWINWLENNLTNKYENSNDVYRRGVKHDIELIDGFKSALREMVRLGTIDVESIKTGKGDSVHSFRYVIRKPQPVPVAPPEVKQRFPNGVPTCMDNADGETYRGALWRKLNDIEHKQDQLATAINAILLALK